MDDNEFVSRLMYCCTCLESVLQVNTTLPLWMFIKCGTMSTFDIPSMPAICFPDEIHLPEKIDKPFTVSLAFYSRRCIHPFMTLVRYRLDHPYKVLSEFDESIYVEAADILSDMLYSWYKDKENMPRSEIYEIYNSALKNKYFRNSTMSLLTTYNELMNSERSTEFKCFCNNMMEKRLREFWVGFAFNFTQGLKGTNKFRLIFINCQGKDTYTDSLLYTDFNTFSDKNMFEKNLRNLFSGIFPPTKYPESKTSKGFDIFQTT